MVDDLDQQENREVSENRDRVNKDRQWADQDHFAQEQDTVQANARCNAEQEEKGKSERLRSLFDPWKEDNRNNTEDQRDPCPKDRSAEDLEVIVGQQCCSTDQHIHYCELWGSHPSAETCSERHPARNGWWAAIGIFIRPLVAKCRRELIVRLYERRTERYAFAKNASAVFMVNASACLSFEERNQPPWTSKRSSSNSSNASPCWRMSRGCSR